MTALGTCRRQRVVWTPATSPATRSTRPLENRFRPLATLAVVTAVAVMSACGGDDSAKPGPADLVDGGLDGGGLDTTHGPSDTADGPSDAEAPGPDSASDMAPSSDTSDDVQTETEDGAAPPPGSWETPIVIHALPFTFTGDTRAAPSDAADRYACAPDTDESGGEFVFSFAPDQGLTLRVAVDDVRGDTVDVDVHLLDGASPDTCVTRNDIAFVATVNSPVLIVADTWVDAVGDELAGPFTLRVTEQRAGPGDCLTNPIECTEGDLPTPNGVPTEPAGLGGCPDGMAPVAEFCIDRWEAALVATAPQGSWSPYANPGDTAVRAVSAPGLIPQGYITGVQAGSACAAAGKRLRTDDEWLRACQGAAGNTFPYGPTHEPSRCNEGRVCHPVVQYFESTDDWIWSELGHPCINQLPDGLAPTGAYPDCTSEDGIFDLHGNLHEWTSNPSGIFRGGFYVDASRNGPGCLYRTTAHSVGHWDYSTGFRCCAGPR